MPLRAALTALVIVVGAGCAERGNPDDALCLVTVESSTIGEPFISEEEMMQAAPTLLERLPADDERVATSCRDRGQLMELAEERTGDECSDLYFRHGETYRLQPC